MFLEFRAAVDRWLGLLSGWPRRLLALGCLMMAAMSALAGKSPGGAVPTVPVAVAAHDLRSGAVPQAPDVRMVDWPANLAPPAAVRALTDVIGRPVSAPMTSGEPFTSARLLDTAITDALLPGEVAVTVHLASAGPPGLIQAGSRIDLFAPPPTPVLVDGASVAAPVPRRAVASAVRVLAVVPDAQDARSPGANVVLAATRDTASQVAIQPSASFLATLLPPSKGAAK